MSAFDEKPRNNARTVSVVLTVEQDVEFNDLKKKLGLKKDSDLLKRALLALIDQQNNVAAHTEPNEVTDIPVPGFPQNYPQGDPNSTSDQPS